MKPIKWVLSALLIVPAVGILALGPRGKRVGKEGGPRPGDVIVDYWEKWTGKEYEQLQEIVDDFNGSVGRQKHIYVQLLSTSDIEQKTRVATAAGVPPDIAGLWDNDTAQFEALDALEPLEDLAAEYGITSETYKPVYWDACYFNGHLNALISTPAAVALHYNKRILAENADALRKAGLDPTRPPATIDELDRFSVALTVRSPSGAIERAGFLPLEPDWYRGSIFFWFGADIWDAKAKKFTLTDPGVIKAYQWVQSYSKRLGTEAINEFHSGVGTFDSPQNPFLTGMVAMEQQGPWMANYIAHLKPSMSEVHWPMSEDISKPMAERLTNYEWAVAPFPSAVPGQTDVSVCPFDTFVIPKGAKHKREAFEFIAYVNRQEVMEKLCKLHCKNSPLRTVSDDFLYHHPNPYIGVFEKLASSPNAHHIQITPVLAEAASELDNVIQQIALNKIDPAVGLAKAQERCQMKYDQFIERQKLRKGAAK